jgi:hypothetical protein
MLGPEDDDGRVVALVAAGRDEYFPLVAGEPHAIAGDESELLTHVEPSALTHPRHNAWPAWRQRSRYSGLAHPWGMSWASAPHSAYRVRRLERSVLGHQT